MTRQRWKLTIEYQGTDYSGWQRQEDGIPSVQQFIEEAIFSFCQQDCRLFVAGRTDAGVHASGQVAHFDLDYGEREINGFLLAKALNAHLRDRKISILSAEPVSEEFHARYGATHKLYTYRILNRMAQPTYDQSLVWHVWGELDIEAMRHGASYLLGHHDFSTFRAAECQAKSPMKTLDRLDIDIIPMMGGARELHVLTEAKSYLHHQVRNMVGTLVLVGQGKWSPEDVKVALEACDRTKGGPTAPPDGLYLSKVFY